MTGIELAGNDVEALFDTLPADATILKWNGVSGFDAVNKLADDAGAWDGTTFALAPGTAIFVQLPKAANVVLTGEVLTGLQTVSIGAGFNFVGSKSPQAGVVDADLGLKASQDDTVLTFNNLLGKYDASNNLDGSASGWDSATGVGPTIGVGQGFIVQTSVGTTTTFARTFTP